MFSCASPDNDEMMRKAASTRSIIALSAGPTASGMALIMVARSLSARQASGEKRSRMTEAAERAAPARSRQRPVEFAARQRRPRDQCGRRLPRVRSGTAFHALEQRADDWKSPARSLVGLRDAVDQGANEPQRRLGALHIAPDPEQIVGGAARQRAGRALH